MDRETDAVLIVGVGNELLGDEGFGVHVARALAAEAEALPPGVAVLDGGTAILDLLGEFPRYRRVIIVDAIEAGGEPGTLHRAEMTRGLVSEVEASLPLSLHQWSVLDTLRVAEKLGLLAGRLTLIGAVPERIGPGTRLSPALQRAARRIVALLIDELRRGEACAPRGTGPG